MIPSKGYSPNIPDDEKWILLQEVCITDSKNPKLIHMAKLIWELSQKLETMILNIPEDKRSEYMAAQVKEKFGGLRFYMEASTPEMNAFIKEAEDRCWDTCEQCGKPGQVVKAGWLYVSCKEHAKKEHQTQFEDT